MRSAQGPDLVRSAERTLPSVEPLQDEHVRVLGCLAEKEATVPDAYPLTLNALRQACNQTSARDPVVVYDDRTVQRALDELKALGLVRFVHPSHGERTTRFRHVLEERLAIDRRQLAVLTVLALRGPQTAAEVRSRTERLHPFADLEETESVLQGLASRGEPLVVALPRLAGHHQGRWAHLLAGPVDVDALAARPDGDASGAPRRGRADDVAALATEVAELRARLDRLERALGVELER